MKRAGGGIAPPPVTGSKKNRRAPSPWGNGARLSLDKKVVQAAD